MKVCYIRGNNRGVKGITGKMNRFLGVPMIILAEDTYKEIKQIKGLPGYENIRGAYNIDGADPGLIAQIVTDSLNIAIVEPLKEFFTRTWDGMVGGSFYICCIITIGGLIFMICGIDKGRKVAITSLLAYLGITVFDYIIKGGVL